MPIEATYWLRVSALNLGFSVERRWVRGYFIGRDDSLKGKAPTHVNGWTLALSLRVFESSDGIVLR